MKTQHFELISHALCPYVQRSIIVLKEKGIKYTRTDIDLANKPDWFKQVSPLGKVPVLLVDDKPPLFESSVICEFIDEVTPGSLHPTNSLDKAFHRSWIEFGSAILVLIAKLYNAKDKSAFYQAHDEIKNRFNTLEAVCSGTDYFAGDKFHLIDAVYAPIFRYFDVFEGIIQLDTFEQLEKCQHWRQALSQRELVKQAVSQDYPERLSAFLSLRDSYLSKRIKSSPNQTVEFVLSS